ncbi:MAG: HAD family hydrolase [Brevinematales bacterium]|nr:HAD family hydrolase [Brevinematales bacterium]
MKLNGIKWVFFDLGNTLIDEDDIVRYQIDQIQKLSTETGKKLEKEEILNSLKESVMKYDQKIVYDILKTLSRSQEEFMQFIERTGYKSEFEKIYPDAAETLEKLCKKYKLGIIANQKAGTVKRLEKFGISRYFSLCLSSSEIGLRKPDLQIFELALKKAECKPAESVMIGDRLENDIYPAKKCGMKTIRILRGLSKIQIPISKEYEADYTIRELDELFSLL